MDKIEKYEDWADIIQELDLTADLDPTSQDFIISLIEDKPARLSPRQVSWIKDLQERYIGA